jgi:hypothetical protein
MSSIVGVEITQMVAFVDVMEEQINNELKKHPDYLVRLQAMTLARLENKRLSKVMGDLTKS